LHLRGEMGSSVLDDGFVKVLDVFEATGDGFW
jgi:hypothetical protein